MSIFASCAPYNVFVAENNINTIILFQFYLLTFCTSLSMTLLFLVTISIGVADAYSELSDAIAIQQVVSYGGKILFLQLNTKVFVF